MPWLTLSGSNYLCLERISMVPKMFEPLRFDCIFSCSKKLVSTSLQGARLTWLRERRTPTDCEISQPSLRELSMTGNLELFTHLILSFILCVTERRPRDPWTTRKSVYSADSQEAAFFRDLIMKYFLRLFSPFRWFKKGICQFLAKECTQYWLTA